MFKLKIISSAVIVFILTVLITTYLSKSKVKQVSHAAVKVVLDQTSDYKLSLKSLSSENAYSSDYKLTIPYGYYNVKIIGNNDKELFSGKVEKNRVSFPPYEVEVKEESEQSAPSFEPLNEMTLLLPYFTNAKKIIFFDENNWEKFQIDISSLVFPEDYSKKLCGNGICDFGENIIFCYNDCRPR